MGDYQFVEEISNRDKIKSLLIAILIFAFLAGIGIFLSTLSSNSLSKIPVISFLVNPIEEGHAQITPSALFFTSFLGSIFFIPSPDEALYYYLISHGGGIWASYILILLGYFVAQLLNYYLGIKLSGPTLNLVSKKKIYSSRRFINRYGAYGIFLSNLVPFLPGPIVTFALGLARYNFYRLFSLMALGNLIKYGLITLLYISIR